MEDLFNPFTLWFDAARDNTATVIVSTSALEIDAANLLRDTLKRALAELKREAKAQGQLLSEVPLDELDDLLASDAASDAEADGSVRLAMSDGRTEAGWSSDPGLIQAGKRHHVVATVDGGPKLILFVVDGALFDGGLARQFGWGRYSPHFRGPSGGPDLKVGPAVSRLRVYARPLRTSIDVT